MKSFQSQPVSAGLQYVGEPGRPRQFTRVCLVAIVGGSGSGKTFLAERLRHALGGNAAHVSLDDFYRDRSHLSLGRRERLNFDYPGAIDWLCFENILQRLRRGRAAEAPRYDFATHSRQRELRKVEPAAVILVDGLWLLRRPSLRRLFDLSIFLDCPSGLRLKRRLERDVSSRGRTRKSVMHQFRSTVEPMHQAYVEPQRRYAGVILKPVITDEVISRLLELINENRGQRPTPFWGQSPRYKRRDKA